MAKKKKTKAKQLDVLDTKIYPNIDITDELEKSYLDYAMSVIVSRALPDVRDGLKPVHRRILYSMYESSYHHNKPYKKSARIVGDVMGKYHPHGDSAIYESMVRMAQDFTMRLPLIDGQGNYGSMDGDPAAAMRYTEARLDKISSFMLEELEYETVQLRANYDETLTEPKVLPSRFPNIFVNGASGIAVGMATNIPPHNLGEIIDATLLLIDEPDTTSKQLHKIVKGPDFPTGGIISGTAGLSSMYETGRGSVTVLSKLHEEKIKNRNAIVISEIPYLQNKSKLLERIADVVNNKTIEGINDIRDESNKEGVRIVVELKSSAVPEIIKNQLFQYTPLKTSFSSNMLALKETKPLTLNLRDGLSYFVNFRKDVITKRTVYKLNKAREKANILIGLSIAVNNIDAVINLIKKSKTPAEAKEKLLSTKWTLKSNIAQYIKLINSSNKTSSSKVSLDEEQAKAILELRLQKLTALGINEIEEEIKKLSELIMKYKKIINSKSELLKVISNELSQIKEKFSSPRRTQIIDAVLNYNIEETIQKESVIITITLQGYIKRGALSNVKQQKRGGKGKTGIKTRDEDSVVQTLSVNTHTSVLFFSTEGLAYKVKAWKIPEGSAASKGKSLFNILPLKNHQSISSIMPFPDSDVDTKDMHIIFATSEGKIRKNNLEDFTSINASGKIAMKLDGNDKIIGVKICRDDQDIILSTKLGKCIRFESKKLRVFKGRSSKGIRGINLAENDTIVSLSIIDHDTNKKAKTKDQKSEIKAKEKFILSITENGYGKRTSHYDYRVTNRGGKGIIGIVNSQRNGNVSSSFPVFEGDQILISTNKGRVIRTAVKEIRIAGRNTQGVRIIKLTGDEKVVSAIKLDDNLI